MTQRVREGKSVKVPSPPLLISNSPHTSGFKWTRSPTSLGSTDEAVLSQYQHPGFAIRALHRRVGNGGDSGSPRDSKKDSKTRQPPWSSHLHEEPLGFRCLPSCHALEGSVLPGIDLHIAQAGEMRRFGCRGTETNNPTGFHRRATPDLHYGGLAPRFPPVHSHGTECWIPGAHGHTRLWLCSGAQL